MLVYYSPKGTQLFPLLFSQGDFHIMRLVNHLVAPWKTGSYRSTIVAEGFTVEKIRVTALKTNMAMENHKF